MLATIKAPIARMAGRKAAGADAPAHQDEAVAKAAPVPVEIPDPDDWTDGQLEALIAGKDPPRRIYEDGDKIAYYQATDAERLAWNAYVGQAVETFNSNPRLDSYDSVDVYPGFTRAGRQTPWIPPVRFPEWLATRRTDRRDQA